MARPCPCSGGTPQGTHKQNDSGSRAGKTNRKDAPRVMLYYAQKLSVAQGQDSSMDIEEETDPQQAMEHAHEVEPDAMSLLDSDQQIDTEDLTEGETQPILRQILQAVHQCTASVNPVREHLGGLTEEVSLLRHNLQKIRERTTAAEGQISDLEDKLPR